MTKSKTINVVSLLFAIMIFVLTFNLINKFTYLDLLYLLFIIGCFIRYIYIKVH